MSKTIYLYLKTHNKTGLKYLGKTVQDPFLYKGSGFLWNRHLKKHGEDVTTEILFQSTNKEEFKRVATEYSVKWNIVESKDFANVVAEQGDGGDTSMSPNYRKGIQKRDQHGENNPFFGRKHSPQTIEKLRLKQLGKKPSEETRRKLSETGKGRIRSEETRKKLSEALKGRPGTWSGKKLPDNTKQKIREKRLKNNPGFSQIQCSYCGKKGQNAAMKRWHLNKCKIENEKET
jgi:hypothetical protein